MPGLAERIREAEIILNQTSVSDQSDERTRALVHIQTEALDLARGVLLTVDGMLAISAHVLDRALFERLLYAIWVAHSVKNASRYSTAAYEELTRYLKRSVEAGRWELRRKSTGEDVTKEVMEHPKMKKTRRPPGFLDMARETGVEAIYSHFYTVMSMFSHGNTFGLPSPEVAGDLKMLRASASALLHAVNTISSLWFQQHRQVSPDDLKTNARLLGVGRTQSHKGGCRRGDGSGTAEDRLSKCHSPSLSRWMARGDRSPMGRAVSRGRTSK